MWTVVITGFFTLGGTVVGVLLEPVKALIASRARTRQSRSERCAEVMRTATLIDRDLRLLNFHYRSRAVGKAMATKEETEELVGRILATRTDLRLAASLLRLHGPDDLADAAENVIEQERALHELRDAPDTGPIRSGEPFLEASQTLMNAVKTFGSMARKSTR